MAEPRKGIFVIQEILDAGGTKRSAIRFEWDNVHRNSPLQPWDFGLQLRTKRTDYPGGDDPTEQVLGPNFKPFSLRGRWTDKFNYAGYAVDTWRKFELLARSGNKVRLQFQQVFVEGLIVDANFSYLRQDEIKYEFQVSPHHRQPGGFFAIKRSPRSALNARQLRDEVVAIRDAVATLNTEAPRLFLVGSLRPLTDAIFEKWDVQIASLDATFATQLVLPSLEPSTALKRLAAVHFEIANTALDLQLLLNAIKSDTDLFFETAELVIDFDKWSKGVNAESRNMVFTAKRAASQLLERAEPNSLALYQPQAAEHLMGISNRFYNTPHNWRAIASRNGLGNELILTGEELLIIPEATAR